VTLMSIKSISSTLCCGLFVLLLPLSSPVASELDDVTIQVLGLDEVPGTSLEIIDFPTAGISAQGVDVDENIILHHSINDRVGSSDNILNGTPGTDSSGIDAAAPAPSDP
jgi:hypothetical protein